VRPRWILAGAALVALSAAPEACTPSQKAAVETVNAYTDLLTNAICAVAPDVPVDGPLITLVCQVAEGVEAIATVGVDGLPVTTDAGLASDGGTSVVATMALPVTRVYVQVPRGQVAGFLARHAGRKP
jgi:hypothetical protein